MEGFTLDFDNVLKNTIYNGYKFKTEYGTIAKVVNYDDTSGLYMYIDGYKNTGYKNGIYIISNKVE